MKRLVLIFLAASISHATIIKKPPTPIKEIAYCDLVFSEEDHKILKKVMFTTYDLNWLDLWAKQEEVYRLGGQINHLHPLKFISGIVNDPEIKFWVQSFWSDFLKRAGFLRGFVPNMNREAEKGMLHQHIEPFAKEVNIDPALIRPFFETRDWEGLAERLLF
jgi:hypothetical protein